MASPVCLRLSVALCALPVLAALGGEDALAADGPSDNASRSFTDQMIASVLPFVPAANDRPSEQIDPNLEVDGSSLPITLLYLRVSREYLSKRIERDVNRTKPVTDLILGTRIRGQSHTRGKTRLVLVPNADEFQADIEFVGTVAAKTIGHNGPAILHFESDSTFRATKRITLDDAGLSAAPARADATTRLHPRRIESRNSGLLGEIVKQVARRRVAQSRRQADAIASDHTADIVAGDLDRGVAKSFTALSETFASAAGLDRMDLATLTAHRPGQTLHIRLRTTADYAELAMTPQVTTWEALANSLPKVDGNPHVALRVHRSMMSHVAAGPHSTPPIARLLLASLQARLVAPAATPATPTVSPASLASPAAQLSIGLEWLAIDVQPAAEPQVPVHNAQLSTPALAEAAR